MSTDNQADRDDEHSYASVYRKGAVCDKCGALLFIDGDRPCVPAPLPPAGVG